MYPFPHRRLGVQNLTPASFQEIPRLDRIKPLHVHRRPFIPVSFLSRPLLPAQPCALQLYHPAGRLENHWIENFAPWQHSIGPRLSLPSRPIRTLPAFKLLRSTVYIRRT